MFLQVVKWLYGDAVKWGVAHHIDYALQGVGLLIGILHRAGFLALGIAEHTVETL